MNQLACRSQVRFTEFPPSETLDVRSANPSGECDELYKGCNREPYPAFPRRKHKRCSRRLFTGCDTPHPTGVLKGTEKSQMSAVPNRLQEDSAVFDVRFWRSYRMLRFIACRVLGGPEHANKAVENCWHTASRRAPRFDHEGEFRSWLLRVLIDEALALLRNNQQTPKPDVLPEPLPVEVIQR
jgi:hypothetical protein